MVEVCPTCGVEGEGRRRVSLSGVFRCNKCQAHANYLAKRDERLAQVKARADMMREELAEYSRRYRVERGEELNARRRAARAADPERYRSMELAHRRALDDRGIARRNGAAREWRASHPDRVKVQAQVGRAKRTEIRSGTDVRDVTVRELTRIRSAPCLACGATDRTTVDHLIPLVRGGRHSIGNLIPLCLQCNSSKRQRTWMEWRISGSPRALAAFGRGCA